MEIKANEMGKPLVGIGGWLLLLIVKLWIGAAIRLLGGIVEGPIFLNLGFAAFGASAAYLLGRKRPKGVLSRRYSWPQTPCTTFWNC